MTLLNVEQINRWTGEALLDDGTPGRIVGMVDDDGDVTIDPDEAVICVVEFLGLGYAVVRVSDYTPRCLQ